MSKMKKHQQKSKNVFTQRCFEARTSVFDVLKNMSNIDDVVPEQIPYDIRKQYLELGVKLAGIIDEFDEVMNSLKKENAKEENEKEGSVHIFVIHE